MDQNPKKEIVIASVVAVVVAVATAIVFFARQRPDSQPKQGNDVSEVKEAKAAKPVVHAPTVKWPEEESENGSSSGVVGHEQSSGSPADGMSEKKRREAEDEKAVAAFDSLTDKWVKKKGGEIAMKDMDDFVAAFKSVPARRREECLQRALNLIPDEHVFLLSGILFDKSVEKEYVELVFNDVLNRDESVKKIILPKIYKDRSHPCWMDAAWILDVTREIPKKPGTTRRNTE